MKKSIALAAVAGLFGIATIAQASPAVNKQIELTLSGIGTNDTDFNGTSFSAQAQLGYYFNDQIEVYGRQLVSFRDAPGSGGNFDGSSAVGIDYHFDYGQDQKLIPFVGANVGYRYGDLTSDSITAAPEAGIKYYVNDTTFITAVVSYDFLLKESISDGAFNYTLGIGFRF